MSKGIVDHTVKDRERGNEILSRMLAIVKPGSFVRVGSKTIKVDKRACKEYPKDVAATGEVPPSLG